MALIDSERSAENEPLSKDRQDFVDACERSSVQCHVLKRRALEHYLSDKAIKAVKGEKYRALGHYEARESVSPVWSKAENWRIAREMELSDLEGTDLGTLLSAV